MKIRKRKRGKHQELTFLVGKTVAETMLWFKPLSDRDVQRVTKYLKRKYGIR